jgi:hypothetical protein
MAVYVALSCRVVAQSLTPARPQKVDQEHYGTKPDTDLDSEYATFELRIRGRIAQGVVQLAVEKASSSRGAGSVFSFLGAFLYGNSLRRPNQTRGLVQGGHNLVRWVVYPILAQLDRWITSRCSTIFGRPMKASTQVIKFVVD